MRSDPESKCAPESSLSTSRRLAKKCAADVTRVDRLRDWLTDIADPGRRLMFKRLSANDTGATGAHQSGIYLPSRIAFLIAPELEFNPDEPRVLRELKVVSHD